MNSNQSYDGYTLFAPLRSNVTYLVNNCGEIINKWSSSFNPAASVYLLENGNLLKTGKIANSEITFGGVGGKIELFDWDNKLLWEYTYSSSEFTQNHDVFPLPNGNILMLAITTITKAEAILAGRNPALILDEKIYNPQIIELEPIIGTNLANIAWEWNIKDHLIQDFDNTKANFGAIKDHPELLDFNFLNGGSGHSNWLHINSLQYNANLDQIVLSSRILSEIYIIDHSTTTVEASLHSGGNYGKGGDFLYRRGNPEAYNMGGPTNRTLFGQHYPHWIPEGLVDAGKLLIFNNGNSGSSAIDIVSPPTTSAGVYSYDIMNGYGPVAPEWSYIDPTDPQNFFSAILSSAQRLPNGNMLICDGDSGYFFEIDANNNIVWEYINPDTANGILSQGDTPTSNNVFRASKFSKDYPAFNGKDLTPGDPIELNFNTTTCQTQGVTQFEISNAVNIYPNPTSSTISINTELSIDKIEVYNSLGKLMKVKLESKNITIENSYPGVYFIKIYSDNNIVTKKIIKI